MAAIKLSSTVKKEKNMNILVNKKSLLILALLFAASFLPRYLVSSIILSLALFALLSYFYQFWKGDLKYWLAFLGELVALVFFVASLAIVVFFVKSFL